MRVTRRSLFITLAGGAVVTAGAYAPIYKFTKRHRRHRTVEPDSTRPERNEFIRETTNPSLKPEGGYSNSKERR